MLLESSSLLFPSECLILLLRCLDSVHLTILLLAAHRALGTRIPTRHTMMHLYVIVMYSDVIDDVLSFKNDLDSIILFPFAQASEQQVTGIRKSYSHLDREH
jgi:hypothetical protein